MVSSESELMIALSRFECGLDLVSPREEAGVFILNALGFLLSSFSTSIFCLLIKEEPEFFEGER
jgi:hypothetical protein